MLHRKLYIYGNLDRDNYIWQNSISSYRKYILKAGRIELFFQLSDEGNCIVSIEEFNDHGFTIKKRYSKEEFLQYLGMQNGQCSAPAYDDLTSNEEYKEFAEKYNITLSHQQRMAVQAINGANLMIAVPGSGKTTVMVARMGYMIFCKGIAPENILAITYTKSATKDIKDRFAGKFGQETANRLNIRTINSLCYKIVNEYSKESNAPYMMLTQNEQEGIIRQVYINVTGDKYPHEADLLSVQTVISYAKNMMLTTPEMRSKSRCYSENPKYEEMYSQYRDILRNQHKMDFDDQLVYAKSILEKRPQILKRIQAQYQYICVDEAQDTSKIQHCIIRQIAEYSNNIFMVGDEDQSIYGFRAAYPQALLDFTNTYVNPYVLFLETNYRSTSQIVYAAQEFISKNFNRHSEKNMQPVRRAGKELERIDLNEKHEQYSRMADICEDKHGEIAVLYRNNSSAVPLMDLFLRRNIPFKRLQEKGENFFTNRVVGDIVAFLRFAINPNDENAFMQIYYKCGYGFKKQAATWSCKKAKQKRITIAEELVNQLEQWESLRRKAVEFMEQMETISCISPYKAIRRIRNNWYSKYATQNGLDIGIVGILESLAFQEATIESFLQRLAALAKLIENYKCESDDPVILSTIHSAKGLEFDIVYIVDAYLGCFPQLDAWKNMQNGEIEEYEEERRLFYVAMTRAKNELYLFTIKESSAMFVDEVIPLVKDGYYHYDPNARIHRSNNPISHESAKRNAQVPENISYKLPFKPQTFNQQEKEAAQLKRRTENEQKRQEEISRLRVDEYIGRDSNGKRCTYSLDELTADKPKTAMVEYDYDKFKQAVEKLRSCEASSIRMLYTKMAQMSEHECNLLMQVYNELEKTPDNERILYALDSLLKKI